MSNFNNQLYFGTGTLVAQILGNPSTPIRFGTLQDIQVDSSFDTKMMYGQNQWAIAFGRGKAKGAIKAKFAQLNGFLINTLFFNASLTTGTQLLMADSEAHAVPGNPYQVTVTNSATWQQDLGVVNTVTGLQLTRVASGPTTGQYSVAAGVYTFAAADTTINMAISYVYTAAQGNNIVLANQVMGSTPVFQLNIDGTFDGRQAFFQFNCVTSSKLSFAPKNDDFMVPEMDFDFIADSSGNVGKLSFNL